VGVLFKGGLSSGRDQFAETEAYVSTNWDNFLKTCSPDCIKGSEGRGAGSSTEVRKEEGGGSARAGPFVPTLKSVHSYLAQRWRGCQQGLGYPYKNSDLPEVKKSYAGKR